MRIAHLILAHKNPEQLAVLIEMLSHPAFDFYIHIDKKQNEAPFRSVVNKKNVFFIEERVNITWGGWGTIQATLNGFKIILPRGYDYINVISGQDLPIKPCDYIHQYFLDRKGTEFITCDSLEGDWEDAVSRIRDYHLINWRIPGKHRLEKIITRVFPQRSFPLKYQIVGRANWFSLTTAAADYIIKFIAANPKVVRFFKYTWGADEFIFSTILYNSHFIERIENNLVYVDWDSRDKGHPKLLTLTDVNNLKKSGKLFARKFELDSEPGLASMIKELIRHGDPSGRA